MAKVIIGIGGSKGAGKTTAAQALFKYEFKELGFATPLKQACAVAFDLDHNLLDDPIQKDLNFLDKRYIGVLELSRLCDYLSQYHDISMDEFMAMRRRCEGHSILSPRDLMQFVGTDLIRTHIDPEFWVKALAKDMEEYDHIVIPDVRFANERRFIEGLGGRVLLIKRDSNKAVDAHPSESSSGEDKEYTAIFNNNGTIADLHKAVDTWYVGYKAMRLLGM